MTDSVSSQTATSDAMRSIGLIVSARGLKGELKIKPWDDHPAWVGKLNHAVLVQRNRQHQPVTIVKSQLTGNIVIMQLDTVTDRTQADKLRGLELMAAVADLPALSDDEFYCDQLVGLMLVSQDSGRHLGRVKDVVSYHGQDYFEVTPEAPFTSAPIIPFQHAFISTVSLEEKTMMVKGLDALFDE